MTRRTFLVICMAWFAVMAHHAAVFLKVTNPSGLQRQEVMEWDACQVWKSLGVEEGTELIVKNAFGQTVTYQVTHDKKLLLDVSLLPDGKAEFTVEKGWKTDMKPSVFGKLYRYRAEDVAWENDITAYRVYGPALQRRGEQAYGIDVWLKSTKDLDVDRRYALDYQYNIDVQELRKQGKENAIDFMNTKVSFHLDHGTGLDCYNVGPSLGCGTPAVILADSIVMPYCYKDFEILDNGPLRFTLQLTFPKVNIDGREVTEHRIISLDKGCYFNRMEVWYDGFAKPVDVCGGVVVHTKEAKDLTLGKDFIAYDDPTDSPERHNFQIYTGLVFPDANVKTRLVKDPWHKRQGIEGNAVGVRKAMKPGEHFVYWFGASWCQSGTPDHDFWLMQIKRFVETCRQPVKTWVE